MRGKVDEPVGRWQVVLVQIERIARRGVGEPPWRRSRRLRLVEAVERAAAAVADEDDVFEADRAQVLDPGGDVEEQRFVDAKLVVVEPAAVLPERGEAGIDDAGNRIVPAHVGLRVHEADDGTMPRRGVKNAAAQAAVGG